MTGKFFLRVCLLLACVVFLVSMLSSNVLADDIDTATQPDATTSETETIPTNSDAVDEQIYLEIEDLKQEIEDLEAYWEEEEQRQEEQEDRLIKYVRGMKKNELQEALLQLLFDGPEWQYDRFIEENL